MELKGYFTVEAALIIPFVLGIIFLVIYMFFYKYDRCLMEQDHAEVLVEGVYAQGLSSQERADKMAADLGSRYTGQYYAWEENDPEIIVSGGKAQVKGGGTIRFPFPGLRFWDHKDEWEAAVCYKGSVIKKMFGIRTFRKVSEIF